MTFNFFNDFAKAGIRTDFVVVSYSVRGMTQPLMHRYAGDYLYKMIMDPDQANALKSGIMDLRDSALKIRQDGNIDASIEAFNRGLGSYGEDAGLYYDLAISYLAKKDFSRSVKFLEDAIKLNTEYFLGYVEIGSIILSRKEMSKEDRTEAVSGLLQHALGSVMDSEGAKGHIKLGNAMLFNGDARKAQIQYSMALKQKYGLTQYEFHDF